MSEAPADFVEEPIAEGPPVLGVHPEVPRLGGEVPRRVMVKRLVGLLVDVVGTMANNRGCTCPRHSCCGMQVSEKSQVAFVREQLVFRDSREEDVIAVYLVLHGVMTCKVGFLPAHLNQRAHDYDGLVARVVAVYTDRCTNVVKRQNIGATRGAALIGLLGNVSSFNSIPLTSLICSVDEFNLSKD
jgi:hypothetical protein